MQTGHHCEIGPETTSRDNHSLRLQCIVAAIGILHLHAFHCITGCQQSNDFVRRADLNALIGCGIMQHFHQVRSDGCASLRAVCPFYATATHQTHIGQVGTESRQPRDGDGSVLHEILYQRRDVFVFAALHGVVVE